MNIINERWLPVPDYPHYEVSDFGRVRSIDHVNIDPNGISRRFRGKLLSPVQNQGYGWITLGIGPRVLIHRLVLSVFVGPCPVGMHGCHGDGDSGNNQLTNLRWDTPKGNAADTIRMGRSYRALGELSSCAKITERQAMSIIADSRMHSLIAKDFGIHPSTVSNIKRGYSWPHLSRATLNSEGVGYDLHY